MVINRIIKEMIGRDDYEVEMKSLAIEEPKHAPRFDFDDAPDELILFKMECDMIIKIKHYHQIMVHSQVQLSEG